MEGQSGYEERIRVLNEFKKIALIEDDDANFDKHFKLAKEEMAFVRLTDASEKDRKTLQRGVNFLKQLFSPPSSPTSPLTKSQNKKEK